MFRRCIQIHENWRELYHRIHGPRRLALAQWLRDRKVNATGVPGDGAFPPGYSPNHAQGPAPNSYVQQSMENAHERHKRDRTSTETLQDRNVSPSTSSPLGGESPQKELVPHTSGSYPTARYRYNRWWVSNSGDFVEQIHVFEDPRVIERRRTQLPDPTHEDLWRKNQCPFFTPFEPFVKVMDYPDDPDAKHLYSATIPKWKDFMKRTRPPIPRTWY